MSKKFTLTLGRECGAGATQIAGLLSKQLGIPCYNKDFFRMVSDKSGVLESYFHLNDESTGNNPLYKMVKELHPEEQKPSLGKDIVSPDNLFRFQTELIRELSDNESCIIVGRCADYVLRDHDNVVNVFVCGDMPSKTERMIQTFALKPEVAKARIKETDKQRGKYYSYYTGKTWGAASNYDLCLNTGTMTIEQAAGLLRLYLEQKEYI